LSTCAARATSEASPLSASVFCLADEEEDAFSFAETTKLASCHELSMSDA